MLFSKLLKAGATASLVLTCAGANAQSWSSNSNYGLYVNPTKGTAGNVSMGFTPTSSFSDTRLTIKSESGKSGLKIINSEGSTKLWLNEKGGLSVGTSGSASTNGLLVSGKTQLKANLVVDNGAEFSGDVTFKGRTFLKDDIIATGSSNTFYNGMKIYPGSNSGAHLYIGSRNGNTYLKANGVGAPGIMNFGAKSFNFVDGNVGIGTDSPSAKLHVNGKILCTEEIEVADLNTNTINVNSLNAKDIQMDMHGAADYVFDDNYNLKSLSEVESYVNEHKHLPGMPSAAEMDANGVSVSQLSNLLLEKVEELTLHMIQLEKENAALKAKVESLSK